MNPPAPGATQGANPPAAEHDSRPEAEPFDDAPEPPEPAPNAQRAAEEHRQSAGPDGGEGPSDRNGLDDGQ